MKKCPECGSQLIDVKGPPNGPQTVPVCFVCHAYLADDMMIPLPAGALESVKIEWPKKH